MVIFKTKKIINSIRLWRASPKERANILRDMGYNIGKECEIYQDVSFGSEPYLIHVGNRVRITKGVHLITHDGGVWVLRNEKKFENADLFGPITIGNNVHIGINSIIMPGVTIGDNVIVGVNSVVTKDIPKNSVAAGIPARVIKSIQEYAEEKADEFDYTKRFSAEKKREYLESKYILSDLI